ncbi:MAG: DUF4167 domain-containing protein [Pelagimonas sp.]|jgi:hypothetical protein|nr:DUF4167 domain-containing protein [Pelagimonas sp.]
MRSSKSRSRNKNNRNRNSLGNVVNRVFDSSGPEGKVRGTPQQIIDKYNQLARDATLSNDRVAAENFQQHAEHYMRLLSDAQREQEARREQQERDNRERQAQRDRDRAQREAQQAEAAQADQPDGAPMATDAPQPVVMDPRESEEAAIVETPEAKAESKPRKPRAPRKPKAEAAPTDEQTADTQEAQAEKPKKPRAPRKPRKPAAEPAADAPAELPLETPAADSAE